MNDFPDNLWIIQRFALNYYKTNRFQEFFEEDKYLLLKNYLYNYLLRKMAVEKSLQQETPELILEVGSGISPVMTRTNNIIYSDLSLTAIQILKLKHGKGIYLVADGMNLPFKPGVFSHTICSEVLEHLEDDRQALRELVRVMKPSGQLIITFPHKKAYFSKDDHFANHFRRYELREMKALLRETGLTPIYAQKVLGPLEKLTMCFVVFCFAIIKKYLSKKETYPRDSKLMNILAPFFKWGNQFYMGFVWLDAMIMPLTLSTVVLMKAEKT